MSSLKKYSTKKRINTSPNENSYQKTKDTYYVTTGDEKYYSTKSTLDIKKNKQKTKPKINYTDDMDEEEILNRRLFSSASSTFFTKNKKKKKNFLSPHQTMDDFRKYGLASLKILEKNIAYSPIRYMGFSTHLSSNVLRNSSYCWSFPKEKRLRNKKCKLNDNIYNIPSFSSTRYTTLGLGPRRDLRPTYGKGVPPPGTYKIKSIFDINRIKGKGPSFGLRHVISLKHNKFIPGPGAYNVSYKDLHGDIPIILKSRQGFFYDDDLKQKKATVSMQLYHPKYCLVEKNRFKAITFGIGNRPKLYNLSQTPGPGAYNVPGCFDRGLKGKLPLN